MTKYGYCFCLLFFLFACKKTDKAQSIVDRSIEFHGGESYNNFTAEFDFRGRHYILERDNGYFRYHRIFDDSIGEVHDILDNNGFVRLANDEEIPLSDDWKRRYSNSVNSVAYFFLLPFGLNDPAVNKRYLGISEIEGVRYHKIEVTFDAAEGGEDHEDVFVFWFEERNSSMDYFAYSYKTDGGGARFRKAIDTKAENGIRFSNYINYQPSTESMDIYSFDSLYVSGKMEELSRIIQENISIVAH